MDATASINGCIFSLEAEVADLRMINVRICPDHRRENNYWGIYNLTLINGFLEKQELYPNKTNVISHKNTN